jgi:hypothetical protein
MLQIKHQWVALVGGKVPASELNLFDWAKEVRTNWRCGVKPVY